MLQINTSGAETGIIQEKYVITMAAVSPAPCVTSSPFY